MSCAWGAGVSPSPHARELNHLIKKMEHLIKSRIYKSRTQKYLSRLAPLMLLLAITFTCVPPAFASYVLIGTQLDSSGSATTSTNSPTLVIGSFVAGGSGTMYDPDLKMYGWTNSSTNGFAILLATNNATNPGGAICRWDLSNDYSSGSYPTSKTTDPLFLHTTTDTCNGDPVASPGSGVNAGTTYYWKILTSGTTNIATDVTNSNMYFELGTDLDLAPTDGITPSAPANSATDVYGFTNFTGTYDNPSGTYDTVLILLQDDTTTTNPLQLIVCDTATTGNDLPYTCNRNNLLNNSYSYSAILWDSTQTFPAGTIDGMSGTPWTFATGSNTAPIPEFGGNDCSTFDIGCYIVYAFTWAFLPTDASLQNFHNLTLEHSLPFSYIYDIPNLYDDLFDSSAYATLDIGIDLTDTEHVTFIGADTATTIPFYPFLRNLMSATLYFGTAVFLYRKITNVHDQNHQTV
jgi:hypothetical protein